MTTPYMVQPTLKIEGFSYKKLFILYGCQTFPQHFTTSSSTSTSLRYREQWDGENASESSLTSEAGFALNTELIRYCPRSDDCTVSVNGAGRWQT